MARCSITGKGPSAGKHVSHSQVRARRMFQPNIQKVSGVRMSTRALRTLKNKGYLVIG